MSMRARRRKTAHIMVAILWVCAEFGMKFSAQDRRYLK